VLLAKPEASQELQGLGCRVVVVAQGLRESGLQWKKDYNLPFRLVIDEKRNLYRQFGLRKELKLVWKLETFAFYAAKVIAGGTGNMVYDGDDMTVMGGDFIIKQSGEVVYAHSQEGQFDRPKLADFLQCLKKYQ